MAPSCVVVRRAAPGDAHPATTSQPPPKPPICRRLSWALRDSNRDSGRDRQTCICGLQVQHTVCRSAARCSAVQRQRRHCRWPFSELGRGGGFALSESRAARMSLWSTAG